MIIPQSFPIYWGWEQDPEDRSFVARAYLREVLPPYRLSDRAIRIRVSPRHWLHLGLFNYDNAVGRYGLTDDLDVIREWRGPRAAIEEDDCTGADAEQV